jgi:glycosyltransferase involved in cell wall biosynthesis
MAARPSIVFTYPFPLGTKAAGGSRTTPEVARHLARLGCDVTILSVSTNPLSRRFPRKPLAADQLGAGLAEKLASEGVELVRVPQHWFHYQFDPLALRAAFRAHLRKKRVDYVIATYNEAGALLSLLRRRGAKLTFLSTWQTYSVLDRSYHGLQGRLKKWAEQRYTVEPHRQADLLFAISEFTKRELVEILRCDVRRILVTPLGVDPSFGAVPRRPAGCVRNLLFFGRVTPMKGFLDALEALGKLAARGKRDWTYRIVGTGRHDWARAKAAELGIAERVELSGPVDDAGLRRELEWADLAILPSHAESFGLSFVEAQAAGIPVVGFAAGSVPEVVADGETGWLAPFRDVDALAARIEAALDDPRATHAAGLRARERALRLYRWDRTAETILTGLKGLG